MLVWGNNAPHGPNGNYFSETASLSYLRVLDDLVPVTVTGITQGPGHNVIAVDPDTCVQALVPNSPSPHAHWHSCVCSSRISLLLPPASKSSRLISAATLRAGGKS